MPKIERYPENHKNVELPFQRKENEGDDAWHGCIQYVLMGKGRSVIDAYRIYAGKPDVKQASGSYRSWFKRFDWEDRARRYDMLQDREAKSTITKAIARVRKGCEQDYSEIFTELKRLVIEDLAIDTALQILLNQEIDRLTLTEGEVSTTRLRELVLIRKELLSSRKLGMEQASAVYGFGLMSGVENVVDIEPLESSTEN